MRYGGIHLFDAHRRTLIRNAFPDGGKPFGERGFVRIDQRFEQDAVARVLNDQSRASVPAVLVAQLFGDDDLAFAGHEGSLHVAFTNVRL